MASKSYLMRFLILIVVSVFASARTPPMVPNHEASVPLSSPMSTGGGGKVKNIGGDAPNPTAPLVSSPMSLGGAQKTRMGGYFSDPVANRPDIRVASEPFYPPDVDDAPRSPMSIGGGSGGKKNLGVYAQKNDDDGKLKPDGIAQPASMKIGLIPIIPGGDGSFQFGLGPVDFGFNFGWGGLSPGYVLGFSQPSPNVIVSPYSSPYPIMPSPYLPPGPGYSPVPAQPSQGYALPYPAAPANSAQMGGAAWKLKND